MSNYSPVTKTSTTAIISLIAGILGFLQVLPIIGPLAAVITGHMAKKEIRNSNGMITGNGMATAGLIMGYISLALGLCACLIFTLTFFGLVTLPFAFPTYSSY